MESDKMTMESVAQKAKKVRERLRRRHPDMSTDDEVVAYLWEEIKRYRDHIICLEKKVASIEADNTALDVALHDARRRARLEQECQTISSTEHDLREQLKERESRIEQLKDVIVDLTVRMTEA